MQSTRRTTLAVVASLSLGGAAFAQSPVRVRGTIDSVDSHEMRLTTTAGDKATLKLADDLGVTIIAPIAIDAIKPGSFIGTAAVSQPDGTLKAGVVRFGAVKSKTSARLFAVRSRTVSGGRPNRHSIIFKMDV